MMETYKNPYPAPSTSKDFWEKYVLDKMLAGYALHCAPRRIHLVKRGERPIPCRLHVLKRLRDQGLIQVVRTERDEIIYLIPQAAPPQPQADDLPLNVVLEDLEILFDESFMLSDVETLLTQFPEA